MQRVLSVRAADHARGVANWRSGVTDAAETDGHGREKRVFAQAGESSDADYEAGWDYVGATRERNTDGGWVPGHVS